MKTKIIAFFISLFIYTVIYGQSHNCVASFQNYRYSGLLQYSFTENATSGNQNAYHWDFGDGKDTSTRHLIHTFSQYGQYNVCLTVYKIDSITHDTLCSDTTCQIIAVGPKCHAGIDNIYYMPGLKILFNVSTLGSQNFYHWDFGDGKYLDNTSIYSTHSFPHSGQYNVCLTVYNIDTVKHDTLCSDTVCKQIIVAHICFASYVYNQISEFGYQFNETTGGDQNRYHWDFGDGTQKDTNRFIIDHYFPANGSYNVCLMVYDIDSLTHDTLCSDTMCKPFVVGPNCISIFTSYRVNDFTYKFSERTNVGTQTGYIWDFGDGVVSDTFNVITHTYSKYGYHTVCLTVYQFNPITHDTLCSDSSCKIVYTGAYCNASFTYSQSTGLNFHFSGDEMIGPQYKYRWDFGDGTTLDSAECFPTHTYPAPGIYYVCLTVYKLDPTKHDTLCLVSTCDSIKVILNSIIQTTINKNSIMIYPNPANNELVVNYPAYSTKNKTSLEFFSINGKLMNSIIMDRSTVNLNISTWPSGVYLIRITTGDKIIMKRIIKE